MQVSTTITSPRHSSTKLWNESTSSPRSSTKGLSHGSAWVKSGVACGNRWPPKLAEVSSTTRVTVTSPTRQRKNFAICSATLAALGRPAMPSTVFSGNIAQWFWGQFGEAA